MEVILDASKEDRQDQRPLRNRENHRTDPREEYITVVIINKLERQGEKMRREEKTAEQEGEGEGGRDIFAEVKA